MNEKFTPGPWRSIKIDNSLSTLIFDEKYLCIGEICETSAALHIDGQANAHLIASAPDLYDGSRDDEKSIGDLVIRFVENKVSNLEAISELLKIQRGIIARLARARGEWIETPKEKV